MTKRTNKQYPNDFKQEAVALVTEQGYSVGEAAASLNITDKLLYNWVAKLKLQNEDSATGAQRSASGVNCKLTAHDFNFSKQLL